MEKSIREIIPLKGSKVNDYRLFHGKEDDSFNEMINFIKTELK